MQPIAQTGGVTRRELLLMVLVLAGLALAAIPRISRSAQNVLENACDANVGLINAAVDQYAWQHGGCCPYDTAELESLFLDDPASFPDGPPECPLRGTYIWDPRTRRVQCTHQTCSRVVRATVTEPVNRP